MTSTVLLLCQFWSIAVALIYNIVEHAARGAKITTMAIKPDGRRYQVSSAHGHAMVKMAPSGLLQATGRNFVLLHGTDNQLLKERTSICTPNKFRQKPFTIMARQMKEEVMVQPDSIVMVLFRKRQRTKMKPSVLFNIYMKAKSDPLKQVLSQGERYRIALFRVKASASQEEDSSDETSETVAPLRIIFTAKSPQWCRSGVDSDLVVKFPGESTDNRPFIQFKLDEDGQSASVIAQNGAMAYGSIGGNLLDWVPKGFEYCLVRPVPPLNFRIESISPKTVISLIVPYSDASQWLPGKEPAALHLYVPFLYTEDVDDVRKMAVPLAAQFCPKLKVHCLFAFIDVESESLSDN